MHRVTLSSLRNRMRRSREMGLVGMSHQPCRGQKTTDPEKPSFPSFPHRSSVSTRQRRVRDREPSKHTGRSNSSRVCGLLRGDPLPPWKKRDERHGRRTALPSIIDDPACIYGAKHVLEPVLPIGSANRMRHRIRVPTRPPLSLSLSILLSPLLRVSSLRLSPPAPRRSNVSVRFLQGIGRASLEGVSVSSFLPVGSGDFRDSATRSTDVGRSLCLPTPYFRRGMRHLGTHHRASTLSSVKYYTERNPVRGFDSIFFFFLKNDGLEKRTLRWMIGNL